MTLLPLLRNRVLLDIANFAKQFSYSKRILSNCCTVFWKERGSAALLIYLIPGGKDWLLSCTCSINCTQKMANQETEDSFSAI